MEGTDSVVYARMDARTKTHTLDSDCDALVETYIPCSSGTQTNLIGAVSLWLLYLPKQASLPHNRQAGRLF